MAAVRLNKIDNAQVLHRIIFQGADRNGGLMAHAVNFPGSLSFNNVAMIINAVPVATTGSFTFSFGLYSLNASTLSIANSGSLSFTASAAQTSWRTFATSATQDITPGTWYFAINLSSSMGAGALNYVSPEINGIANGLPGGGFFRGGRSASISNMPASIATSDFVHDGAATSNYHSIHPYILITA